MAIIKPIFFLLKKELYKKMFIFSFNNFSLEFMTLTRFFLMHTPIIFGFSFHYILIWLHNIPFYLCKFISIWKPKSYPSLIVWKLWFVKFHILFIYLIFSIKKKNKTLFNEKENNAINLLFLFLTRKRKIKPS